ncbi:hypothetical protein LPTSP4_17910 [Leptospira ryugenii]|uniref:Uncharacterized protein n=1 Tax=Leptospira ryugenii TaxID=1917863 RepID=A0A2P2E0D0_9LEPT|nr:hypothetical protein [Leptospira ryugenii]GBF50266.1 hypothetical protein LPTSP4_17910 [Leptospira ryugenii]
MWYILLEIDKELAQILSEKHLDLGMVTMFALRDLFSQRHLCQAVSQNPHSSFLRLSLTKSDFFQLYQIAEEIEVDPNRLLSYAFTQTVLDLLRL